MKILLKYKKYYIFYLLLLIFAFSTQSCEFDSDVQNYVDVEKPKEEIPLISIDLAGVNPEEIIYVYNDTYFKYTLFTDNKEVLKRQFYLDGNPIESYWNGETYLHVNSIDKEIHELKLVISLKTGTGSLAEYAGLEMYTGECTFKLKFIAPSNKLNIRQTTDNNGYLKLEWDNPTDYEVISYDIYNGSENHGELLATINNLNETYFMDTEYAYGYKHYTIVAKIKNSYNVTVIDDFTAEYIPMTENNLEIHRISANQAYLKWNNPNPFPCKYVLRYGYFGDKIIIDNNTNDKIIPIGYFPESDSFYMFILPQSANIDNSETYPYVYGSYSDKTINGGGDLVADTYNKQLHTIDFHTFKSIDISSMQQISSIEHDKNLYSAPYLKVSKDGKVAFVDAFDMIHVYSDITLSNEIATLQTSNFFVCHFFGNNKILSAGEYNEIKISDIETNSVVFSKKWDRPVNVGVSPSCDGKYLYVTCFQNSEDWTELYEMQDNKLTLIEKKNALNTLQYASFNPIKPTEIIVTHRSNGNEYFVIQDIVTKEEKRIEGQFVNIDPFTGNLLYIDGIYNDNSAYILDKTYNKNLITLRFSNHISTPNLYNNNLTFRTTYLDLTTLKEWNK